MTTEWTDDYEELKRTTIARMNEIKAEIEKRRRRQERRRRRLQRLTFGLLGR